MKTPTETYLLIIFGIFTIPYLLWKICKTDRYAPLVVVQIVCGVIFGPGIFGYFFPNQYSAIFTTDTTKFMTGVATWAVVMFVATAGVEVNLKAAKEDWKETITTSVFALITPLVVSLPLAYLLSSSNRWMGVDGQRWQFSLSVGMALSITALPILIILLEKMDILKKDIGVRCLRYASFDDIAIWTVFAIILLEWDKVLRQTIFLSLYFIIFLVIQKFSSIIKQQDRLPFLLMWIAVCSLAADWSGLHYIVGGFLAGLVINEDWLGEETVAQFRKYVLLLIMPIFFLSTGLRTDWELKNPIVIGLAIVLFVVQAFGKMLGVRISAVINGWNKRDAMTIGWLLQTKALIEIIFCTVMLDKGIISAQMFTALLFMAIFSTVATTPIVTKRLKFSLKLGHS
jgi:Kef-type K+ transport system membrane component KefB